MLASNQLEVGIVGIDPILLVVIAGSAFPAKSVYNVQSKAQYELFTVGNSPITKVEDLKGKKAAVAAIGSTPEPYLRKALEEKGLKLDDVTQVATGAGIPMGEALKRGDADFGISTRGQVGPVEQAGTYNLKFLPRPVFFDSIIAGNVVARSDLSPAKTQALKGYLRAYTNSMSRRSRTKRRTTSPDRSEKGGCGGMPHPPLAMCESRCEETQMGELAEQAAARLVAERTLTMRSLLDLTDEECARPVQYEGRPQPTGRMLRNFTSHTLDHFQHLHRLMQARGRTLSEAQLLLMKAEALQAEFTALLRTLSDAEFTQTGPNEGDWSASQILDHVINNERKYRETILSGRTRDSDRDAGRGR